MALTTKEFEIVAFLAAHPGKVFTRSQIQEYIWGESDADCKPTNNITVFVRKIREKIEENPRSPSTCLPSSGWATRWPTPWSESRCRGFGFRGATSLQKSEHRVYFLRA